MGRSCIVCIVLAVLSMGAAGCRRPRLVSRPLTEKEATWARVIDGSYRAWKPPFFTPVQGRPPVAAPQAVIVPSPVAAPRQERLTPTVPATPSPQWLAPLRSEGPDSDGGLEFVPVD